ncbi:DNA helicase [Pseudomonas phage PspYZU01]|uniref:Helicase ATP-binding domain-containing protein n=1 Tax=Pseudomonas phage PspYZU01 TaxID=1983555 RepID=A0A2U7NLP6_9CAUD|nr:DNA helicase [Pseudomonas phage PspYZU01]ASD51938.1 hypothetical protein PspYZU01_53 [Pseudomonas phage PspYZU01]
MRRPYEALRKSQHKIIQMIKDNTGTFIAADMGIGKTGATLTAIRDLLDLFEVNHVLVVAPKLVAEETWPEEIDTWAHTHVLDYEVLTGDAERREQRARRLPELSIINRENLQWLLEFWGKKWPYDMLVLDELSSYKSPTVRNEATKAQVAKETERVLAEWPIAEHGQKVTDKKLKQALAALEGNLTRFGVLCAVRKRASRVVGLTGTPSPNGLLDIWSQYFLIDQGVRLGTNFYQYRKRYFQSDFKGYKYTLDEGSFDIIMEKVADITVAMKTSDFTDMPPMIHNVVRVKLPPKVMKQYKEFERTMLLEEHDIEAVNSGVLTGKLLQLANGSVYGLEREVFEFHSLKLEALDNIVEEAQGAPILVFYSYEFDLIKLRKRYPYAEVVGEAKNVQKRWNAGQIRMLVAHPASAGHGLNLQYGGHIAVWYGLNWSLELTQQANKRLLRPGQDKPVIIHSIVATGTKDEDVLETLPIKNALQEAMLDAHRWTGEGEYEVVEDDLEDLI